MFISRSSHVVSSSVMLRVSLGCAKSEREQRLRKNCTTETLSPSCQSETPRQQIVHPRHSILNEELITGFIFKG